MVLEQEWQLLVAEMLLEDVVQKEEKDYQLKKSFYDFNNYKKKI